MIIGIDGACKWGGTPECVSCGVAVINDDENIYYKSTVESESTSQRGELNGLLMALEEACKHEDTSEDVIIITDSEYIYNAITKEWCQKWKANNWIGSTGSRVKNVDKWERIVELVAKLEGRLFMQWTKGHLISNLSDSVVKRIVDKDPTGISLIDNISTLANRASECERVAADFNDHRVRQGQHAVPLEVAIEWTVMNVAADLLAGYIKNTVIAAGKI